MRVLAMAAMIAASLACQPCKNAADGGGGSIVIGGCSPQAENVSAPGDSGAEASGDVTVPSVLVSLYLAAESEFDSAVVTAAVTEIVRIDTLLVSVHAFVFDVAADCEIGERQQVATAEPDLLYVGASSDDAFNAVALPQDAWLCGVQLIWAGAQQRAPAFAASGALTGGVEFSVESRLLAALSAPLPAPIQLAADSPLAVRVTFPVAEWLAHLGAMAAPVSDANAIRIDVENNAAILQSIESTMKQTTILEVKNEP